MLVEVVRLRDHGRKLEPEHLAAPIRGELTIELTVWRDQHAALVRTGHARLRDVGGRDLIPYMTDARIDSLRGDRFVVVGTEVTVPRPPGPSWSGPQVWACAVVASA